MMNATFCYEYDMPNLIKRFFSKKPKDYTAQKESLQSAAVKERLSLAKNSATNREILYYLAENDPDPKVREAVAKNKSMPVHVSPVLAVDDDQDVRLALAKRLIALLPHLSEDEQSQIYAFAVQALGTLALDEVLKIRVALTSALKDHAHTPPKVAGQLARDVEREVSEPILRFCAALSDEDLLDILKSHPAGWVIEAIACRTEVSEDVSHAVIESENRPGGTELIKNEGANLGESLLQIIVEKARSFPEWQKPIVVRKTLPVSIAKELASFVDASVRDLLVQRGDFGPAETEEIAAIFRRRVDFANKEIEEEDEPVEQRLKRVIKEGTLDEDTLMDALAMRDNEFVLAAIAYMGKLTLPDVEKVVGMQAPKPIVALSWHAGMSMRMALQLQKTIGQVQPKEILYPKDGTDYPMTEDELNWQLEFLGLKAG